ncbi:MAG: Mur ligase family protein [Candidatus Rokuibacteriota bacterium]
MSPAPPTIPLSEIVGHPRLALGRRAPDPLIRGLAYDSRNVQPGDLFVCLCGAKDDGHRHAADAARRGAVAILGERPAEGLDGLPQITVADSRSELARLAARFYGEPSTSLHLTGVTGTEGKTTTVYLLDAILRGAGRATGMFGTIVNRVRACSEPATLTTPESLDLQRLLWECVQAGVTHVVMEVSSHALAQGRVAGCEFDQAVCTNLHSDHLDFHGTLERYRAAKAALFAGLGRGPTKAGVGLGVVNADDPFASSSQPGVRRLARRRSAGISWPVGAREHRRTTTAARRHSRWCFVVIGYDETRALITAHSGVTENRLIPYREFLWSWGKKGNWTLRIRPKDGARGTRL